MGTGPGPKPHWAGRRRLGSRAFRGEAEGGQSNGLAPRGRRGANENLFIPIVLSGELPAPRDAQTGKRTVAVPRLPPVPRAPPVGHGLSSRVSYENSQQAGKMYVSHGHLSLKPPPLGR